jgi:hypothetical protein
MWANGTVISQQARRALEHERVTIVSHSTGHIHLLHPDATIDPAAYASFSERLRSFLVPPEGSADMRLVDPRLPDASRVRFVRDDESLGLHPDMDYSEFAGRLESLRGVNRVAALVPYAGREMGVTEAAPFVKAALERSPVSRAALAGMPQEKVLDSVDALACKSIYDGPSRLAQPDEVWNFSRGDGLEKCLLVANAIGGDEIAVDAGQASLVKDGRVVVSWPTSKSPAERRWTLPQSIGRS